MRNQYILLSTVCCGLFFGTEAWAQCVATKDCATLGYKQSSCGSGKGIKCPFGEAWYCPCDESYKYTCTGANESPSDSKCGDKYSMCNCATGTHWDNGSCVSDRASCSVGWVYYTDGTCSVPAAYTTSKTVLGIVVYVNPDGIGGQIMAPWWLDQNGNRSSSGVGMKWSTNYNDVLELPNMTSTTLAEADFDSCGNTDKIVAAGNASDYPAAWATRKYAPTSATSGKWCLPAAGVLRNIQKNWSAISTAVNKVGGASNLGNRWVWSSSEYSSYYAWGAYLAGSLLANYNKNGNNYFVVPVLAF